MVLSWCQGSRSASGWRRALTAGRVLCPNCEAPLARCGFARERRCGCAMAGGWCDHGERTASTASVRTYTCAPTACRVAIPYGGDRLSTAGQGGGNRASHDGRQGRWPFRHRPRMAARVRPPHRGVAGVDVAAAVQLGEEPWMPRPLDRPFADTLDALACAARACVPAPVRSPLCRSWSSWCAPAGSHDLRVTRARSHRQPVTPAPAM